jgi:hypothetical protein
MIEMMDDDFVAPEQIARVKKIDDNTCNVWLAGQSALEPAVVKAPAREFANAVNEALDLPPCEEEEDDGKGDDKVEDDKEKEGDDKNG